jgi:hypothetical protein
MGILTCVVVALSEEVRTIVARQLTALGVDATLVASADELTAAKFGKRGAICSLNFVRVKQPVEAITGLWIKITALLQHKDWRGFSRITAVKLLEGILVWRSEEQSQ